MARPRAQIKRRPPTCWAKETVWLDTKRAAMLLGVTTATLCRMARNGEIPAHKLGVKLWRFSKDELSAL